MMYPILDGPRMRAITIEVNRVTMKALALSRPYQPVFFAIVRVFDISALTRILEIALSFCYGEVIHDGSCQLLAPTASLESRWLLNLVLLTLFGHLLRCPNRAPERRPFSGELPHCSCPVICCTPFPGDTALSRCSVQS